MTETPMVDLRQLNVAHDEIADLRRQLTAAQAELKEAWDSIGEHPVGFDLATCIESLKAQNESLTERVTKLKAELAAARADLDSIAKAVYPSKEPRFTYSVQFMVEEIVKARMDTERLRELLWMAWAKALLRARAFYLNGESPIIETLHARDSAENELLRLCVKLMAVKKGKR